MGRILIFTENVENELPMFEKLRYLNYEVFITHELIMYWDKLEMLPPWVSGFPIIMFSETLDINKIKIISRYAKENNQICILKIDKNISKQEQIQLKNIGITSCIHTESKLSNLRETLVFVENSRKKNLNLNLMLVRESQKTFLKNLSPISTRVFITIQQMNGKNISREQLSKKIWKKCNEATLSQLSASVKKINNQIYQSYGISQGVITDWGKGYRLSEELFEG